jgi:ABC-type polysaccharide/polyol phosphate export permease
MLWGTVNCIPTLVMCIAIAFGDAFQENNATAMIIWLAVAIITFAIIFAINSSIHSFLVVNYASAKKVAVSVGFYYMSNACGRLFGMIGSGILYTYVGDYIGPLAGTDAVSGLAACFLAGTICSFVAVIITQRINDDKAGLQCGSCLTIIAASEEEEKDEEEKRVSQAHQPLSETEKPVSESEELEDLREYLA